MLYTVMKHVRNFFIDKGYNATFTIENGSIGLSFIQSGQYFLIEGSVFNDGVYKKTDVLELTDEVFTGRVCALKIPKDFLDLVTEIETYVTANNQNSAFISESFGGYSYTKATGTSGAPVTWQEVFRSRLKIWRKV